MLGSLPPVVDSSPVASSPRFKDKGKASNSMTEGRLSPSRPVSDEDDDVAALASHRTESPLLSPASVEGPEPPNSAYSCYIAWGLDAAASSFWLAGFQGSLLVYICALIPAQVPEAGYRSPILRHPKCHLYGRHDACSIKIVA